MTKAGADEGGGGAGGGVTKGVKGGRRQGAAILPRALNLGCLDMGLREEVAEISAEHGSVFGDPHGEGQKSEMGGVGGHGEAIAVHGRDRAAPILLILIPNALLGAMTLRMERGWGGSDGVSGDDNRDGCAKRPFRGLRPPLAPLVLRWPKGGERFRPRGPLGPSCGPL